MVGNENWGTPNSKAPWSLWRMHTLLGRKPISVGWKAKKLTPFRPVQELMLKLVLPANILDAFRVQCGAPSLEAWVQATGLSELRSVATLVRDQLCSARRVADLRALPEDKRDITLENVILFNRDAIILKEFYHAIKRGDVGSILNVLSYWLHEFRGTGFMPKYSDTVFEVLMTLKDMKAPLRHAYLMSWLVNISGHANRFKEVDLLQEHQNFWMKVRIPGLSRTCKAHICLGGLSAARLKSKLEMVINDFRFHLYSTRRHSACSAELSNTPQWQIAYEPIHGEGDYGAA